ncbi:hypothetical protein [Chryseobacterium viscerum]|nr:hypothetical protein [Chryseobacterium viscerum]
MSVAKRKSKIPERSNSGRIEKLISPYLSNGKSGFPNRLNGLNVFLLNIQHVKTDCQWRALNLKEYFFREKVSR